MGWKVNLQPKLMAESLMKDACTIGLEEKDMIQLISISAILKYLAPNLSSPSLDFKLFGHLPAHLANIAGGST